MEGSVLPLCCHKYIGYQHTKQVSPIGQIADIWYFQDLID